MKIRNAQVSNDTNRTCAVGSRLEMHQPCCGRSETHCRVCLWYKIIIRPRNSSSFQNISLQKTILNQFNHSSCSSSLRPFWRLWWRCWLSPRCRLPRLRPPRVAARVVTMVVTMVARAASVARGANHVHRLRIITVPFHDRTAEYQVAAIN